MGLGFDFNLPVGIIAKIDFTYLVIKNSYGHVVRDFESEAKTR